MEYRTMIRMGKNINTYFLIYGSSKKQVESEMIFDIVFVITYLNLYKYPVCCFSLYREYDLP